MWIAPSALLTAKLSFLGAFFVVLPALVLGTIWTFNQFNVIYLVSHGLPANETNILITEAFRFFRELHQNGIAAAYCLMIFAVLLLYTLLTNRMTRATESVYR